jgi:chromosome segregation ATPase
MSLVGPDGSGGGSGDFLAVAALLADSGRLQALYKELEDKKAQAQAVIALAGPASEILQIRASIDSELESAKAEHRKAKEERDSIVASALAQAAQTTENAAQRSNSARVDAAAILAEADRRLAAASAVKDGADKRLAEVANQEVNLRVWEDKLKGQLADLLAQQSILNERVAALRAAEEQFRAVLG